MGDQKMFNKPLFEAVDVLSNHPIFHDHDTSDITKHIGLPIFTHKCAHDPKWKNDEDNKIFEGRCPTQNQEATFLHLSLDPKGRLDLEKRTASWGWAPMHWQCDVGSVLVVRQDKKRLTPMHMEALCGYCRFDARALIAHSLGEYHPDPPLAKSAVLSMICRATFSISWYKLVDVKLKEETEDFELETIYDV